MKYPVFTPMKRFGEFSLVIRRTLGVSVLLFACHSAAFSQSSENQIEPVTSALRARDYDKAVQLSRAALETSPNNAQLWTLQGIAFASKGDNKDALMAFERALKISPNTIAALAGAAQIEYQAGNQTVVPLLNHLLQLRPEEPTAHAMLAVMEYRKGNCALAAPRSE